MRGIFSLVGLLVVLAVVGLLVKKQMAPTVPKLSPASTVNGGAAPASAPAGGTVLQQSQQLQQEVKKAVEGAMNQPRPMPEDAP